MKDEVCLVLGVVRRVADTQSRAITERRPRIASLHDDVLLEREAALARAEGTREQSERASCEGEED